ncbi:MAG: hypothetical protein ABMA25_07650 [Ilumatobacteraceae bacterium]
MSYQPQPPMGQPAYTPMAAAAPQPAAVPPARSRGLLFGGIALAVVGIGAGAVLFGLSGSTEESTVQKFARAPAGCTTTLQFDRAGVFTLYTETKGTVGNPGGDCAANGGSYEYADDDLPRATLALVDEADAVQTLVDADGASYDVGGYRGQATQQVRIPAKGAYRLTVTSDATNFAIAIGGAPDADSSTMTTGGIVVALAGLVIGGLLIGLGLRKKGGPTAAPAAAGWSPAPAGVPGAMPQYGSVPGYQPPAGYPPQQPGYPQPPTVPGSQQPAAPMAPQSPQAPGWAPQQPSAPAAPTAPLDHHEPPTAPPAPPQGPGWGAPQQ